MEGRSRSVSYGMSANRHLGRIVALQTLYEQDFRLECGDKKFVLAEVLKRNIERYEKTIADQDFVKRLVQGIDKKTAQLDKKIQPLAPEWPLEQIARMDRMVLRMGAYELLFEPKTPPKVAINEAVELAKSFGGDNSSKFINGVLGSLLRQKDAKSSKPSQLETNRLGKPKTTALPAQTSKKVSAGKPIKKKAK